MSKPFWAFPVLLITLSLTIFSCLDNDVDLAKEANITAFAIPDQTGVTGISKIEFQITNPANSSSLGLITNNDALFPYGSLQKKLVPLYNAVGLGQVIYQPSGEDTTIQVISGRTQIDFSSPVVMVAISEDGKSFTNYRVVINADDVNPQQVQWNRLDDSINVDLKEHFTAFYLNNRIYIISGEINPETNSVQTELYSSEDGVNWLMEGAPEFPEGIYHSVEVFNNKAHIIGYIGWDTQSQQFVQKEEIWSSSDGTNWQKTAYPSGMNSVFKNTAINNNQLIVWGGSSINQTASSVKTMLYSQAGSLINPDRTVWYFDGETWTKGADIPEGMAVRFSTSTKIQDRLQVYGGEYADGNFSRKFWSFYGNESWINFPGSNLNELPGSTLISYDNDLWLFGGVSEDLTIWTVQVSKDGGKTFTSINTFEEEQLYPNFNYKPRAYQQVLKTPSDMMYIIGGKNSVFVNDSIITTSLYDLWSAKMNKFNP